MTRLSTFFGKLLDVFAALAALTLLAMVVIVTADILLRNLTSQRLPWANEVSEYSLYIITLLTAPWLLRRGQHVRIDLAADARAGARGVAVGSRRPTSLGFVVCLVMMRYGRRMTIESDWPRLDHHQEPGVSGVVAARAAAALLCFARDRIRVPLSTGCCGAAAAAYRSDLGRVTAMPWVEASLILFGGLVALMALGLPVAFAFLAINIVGALIVSRRRAGAVAARPQRRAIGDELLR